MSLNKPKNDRNNEIFLYKKDVVILYKKGYLLGEICRNLKLDISTVLELLKQNKFKKKRLHQIFTNQTIRTETCRVELILKKDEYYLEKFFPNSDSFFSNSYYWFWREKYKKRKNEKCEHNVRHIRCAICNKILKDATNIPLEEFPVTIIKTPIEQNPILIDIPQKENI